LRHLFVVGGPLAPSRLEELKKRYEENPRRFFAPLANEYRKAGDIAQAIALCQEHLGEQPGNMNGQVVFGQALYDAGRLDESEVTFATALSLDPENLIALRHLGDIARSKNDVGKAIEWYTRVLDADPRNDEILAFIDELKAAEAAAAGSTPTPVVTPAVDDQPTAELSMPGRAAAGTPTTPVAPVDAVSRQAAPPPRTNMSLLDVSLDVGSEPETSVGDWTAPTPPASADSAGDIELSGMAVEGPSDATPTPPSIEWIEAPAEPERDESQPVPALGWEMGAVDLGVGPVEEHAAPAEEPAATPDEVTATPDTPPVFVTETMAELYLQQGLRDEALKVYRQLGELRPDDASVRERIRSLESSEPADLVIDGSLGSAAGQAPGPDTPGFDLMPSAASFADPTASPVAPPPFGEITVEAAPPQGEETPVQAAVAVAQPAVESIPGRVAATARAFFASLAQRRPVRSDGTVPGGIPVVAAAQDGSEAFVSSLGSIDSLFGTTSADGSGDAVGLALATAVGAVDAGASIRGKPTQPASSELSLDSVFRTDSTKRASGPILRQSEVLNFDQFFASAPPPPPAATPPEPGAAPAAPPADDAEFQSWLQILKGK